MKDIIVALAFSTLAVSAAIANESTKTIPFEIEDSFIFLNAKLPSSEDSKQFRLLFDLGDYRAISLTEEVLNQVTHHKLDQYDTFQDYKGDTFKAQRFKIDYFQLGETSFKLTVGSEDIQDPENLSPSPFGAIGAGLFNNQTLTINFKQNHLELSDAPLKQCQSFDPNSGAIVAPLQIDGEAKLFIIDTGTTRSVIDKNSVQLDSSSAESVIVKSFQTQDFELENFPLQVIKLNIPGIDGILGQDVLKQYALSVDFKNACFRFTS